MEFVATQIYEDDDFSPTQKIPDTIEEEELVQVGTLSIDSNEYQIMRGTTKIGRLCSCDIVINDATVSKIHAVIEAMTNQGSRTWICDLNSANKTKLDNVINAMHLYYLHSVYIAWYLFASYAIFEHSLSLCNPVCKDDQLIESCLINRL